MYKRRGQVYRRVRAILTATLNLHQIGFCLLKQRFAKRTSITMGPKHSAFVPIFRAFLIATVITVSVLSASGQSAGVLPAQPVPNIGYEVVSITRSKPGLQVSGWRSMPN